ncbi:DUF4240 domain-containing protein [Frigoriglobus tundricola]|uniref:DUF4240 domain-containing protein n=1 Tax=Frigoriglobus tundricola TaxID=2774151 RepID=A0A6M5YET8_9BACT|nr:DUF4240 domain-containing protein [Frigoriglobus tundricola]QJW92525.1 hypothetical protein FTUN_0021 [Frigoriglobus tundricola]
MDNQELFPSQWFWKLIDSVCQDHDKMQEILNYLTQQELERFHKEFYNAVIDISGDDYCNIYNYGDSRMHDLAYWIVSQGESAYREVYDDPRQIPQIEDIDQSHSYIGLTEPVYATRFGKDIPL